MIGISDCCSYIALATILRNCWLCCGDVIVLATILRNCWLCCGDAIALATILRNCWLCCGDVGGSSKVEDNIITNPQERLARNSSTVQSDTECCAMHLLA